jgi:hypothetical protein
MKNELKVFILKRSSLIKILEVIHINENEFVRKLGIKGKQMYVDDILDQITFIDKQIKRLKDEEEK